MRRKPLRTKPGKRGYAPVSPPALLLFFSAALGILCGYFFAALLDGESAEQLRIFLTLYRSSSGDGALSLLSLLFCYLRAPVLILLCAFSSLGILFLPIICCADGFLLSYSLCSFALSLGTQYLLLLVGMFLLRLLLYLPLVLLLSLSAWRRAHRWFSLGRGKRGSVQTDNRFWPRFGFAAFLLCCGCVAEYWLLPRLLGTVSF